MKVLAYLSGKVKMKEILRATWLGIVAIVVLAALLLGSLYLEKIGEKRYSLAAIIAGGGILVALMLYLTIVKVRRESSNLVYLFRVTTVKVDQAREQITIILELTLGGKKYNSVLTFKYEEEEEL